MARSKNFRKRSRRTAIALLFKNLATLRTDAPLSRNRDAGAVRRRHCSLGGSDESAAATRALRKAAANASIGQAIARFNGVEVLKTCRRQGLAAASASTSQNLRGNFPELFRLSR
jgi:hypothetical protein